MQPLELESDDDLTDSEESVYSGLEDSGSDSTNSSAAEEEEEEEDEGEQEEPSNRAAPKVRSGDGGEADWVGGRALLEHCAQRWAPSSGQTGNCWESPVEGVEMGGPGAPPGGDRLRTPGERRLRGV